MSASYDASARAEETGPAAGKGTIAAVAAWADRLRPLGITLLRLALGVIFLYHGSVKMSHLALTEHSFVSMGFPGGAGHFIGLLEVIAGPLLILGIFSRLWAILFAGEMLTALLHVHLPSGPWWKVTDYGLPMLLSAGSFWVFCYGGGPWSLDRLLFRKRPQR